MKSLIINNNYAIVEANDDVTDNLSQWLLLHCTAGDDGGGLIHIKHLNTVSSATTPTIMYCRSRMPSLHSSPDITQLPPLDNILLNSGGLREGLQKENTHLREL